jgi:hypothetical protein
MHPSSLRPSGWIEHDRLPAGGGQTHTFGFGRATIYAARSLTEAAPRSFRSRFGSKGSIVFLRPRHLRADRWLFEASIANDLSTARIIFILHHLPTTTTYLYYVSTQLPGARAGRSHDMVTTTDRCSTLHPPSCMPFMHIRCVYACPCCGLHERILARADRCVSLITPSPPPIPHPTPFYPFYNTAEGSVLPARRSKAKGDVHDRHITADPESTDDASSSSGDDAIRELSSSRVFLPSKVAFCAQCRACKQQQGSGWGGGMDAGCQSACKKCPNDVVFGAENTLSIEVYGFLAAEYVRGLALRQGRALQSGEDGGITLNQYADTVFNGAAIFKGERVFYYLNSCPSDSLCLCA